ncbi:hypothetical protein CVIRNUC_007898 [Coccomyxa viridis]|uniref:Uncharacterized protein n=1 Tax=Coccomyxa viridis TaxID=1274662 RepID=A0AAV1IBI1_9CHLO|nr:hypothetical protein CVIRNUC_007898 [Coccomyxa viridis]
MGFGWDGTSVAQGSCALGDEGDECRRETLLKSQKKGQANYADVSKIDRPLQNTVGIPVAQMDDAYSQETLKLAEVVDRYASMDVYDAERPKLVGELRKEAGQWVAKYARGGSARKLSARRFYIAVDALQGHLASNGQAPFPKAKIPVLRSNVAQARDLIAQGK